MTKAEAMSAKATVTREHRKALFDALLWHPQDDEEREWIEAGTGYIGRTLRHETIVSGSDFGNIAQAIADAESRGATSRARDGDCHGVAFEVRASESRRLLRRMVDCVRKDNEGHDEDGKKLEACVAQVADYLQRTHDPRSILRAPGEGTKGIQEMTIPNGENLTPGKYYRITAIDPSDTDPSLKVGDVVLCAELEPRCIDPEYQEDSLCWFADYQGEGNGYGTLVNGVELVEAGS